MVGKCPEFTLSSYGSELCHRLMGGHEGVVDSSKHVPAGSSKSPFLRGIISYFMSCFEISAVWDPRSKAALRHQPIPVETSIGKTDSISF